MSLSQEEQFKKPVDQKTDITVTMSLEMVGTLVVIIANFMEKMEPVLRGRDKDVFNVMKKALADKYMSEGGSDMRVKNA